MSDAASAAAASLRGLREPIPRILLRLLLPILASHGLRIAYQWVDALWVRGLGVDATAAVTTSVFVMWWMYSLNDIFAIGVVAYVSQLLGAGERDRAGAAAFLAIRGTLVLGLLGSAMGMFFARDIFSLMTGEPATLDAGASYLSVILAGSPMYLYVLTSEGVMRAAGETRIPFLIDLFAIGINFALDPLLIYGLGPVPGFGVSGAAWATLIAQAIMAISYIALARRGHHAYPVRRTAPGPAVKLLGLFRVGLPAALIGLLFSLVYIAFAASAGEYGAAALAVVGIVNRLEALEYLVAMAVGMAGAALVGQNLGAKQPERAVQAIKVGTRWVIIYSAALSVFMMFLPEFFLSLFTSDPEALRLGVPYLRIVAWCFIFNGIEIVVAESILGSGHTVVISVIFGVFSLMRLPLAFLAPRIFDLGVLGIAWVIAITCVVRSLVIVAWAMRGSWKRGLHSSLQEATAGGPGASSSTG